MRVHLFAKQNPAKKGHVEGNFVNFCEWIQPNKIQYFELRWFKGLDTWISRAQKDENVYEKNRESTTQSKICFLKKLTF